MLVTKIENVLDIKVTNENLELRVETSKGDIVKFNGAINLKNIKIDSRNVFYMLENGEKIKLLSDPKEMSLIIPLCVKYDQDGMPYLFTTEKVDKIINL